MRVKRIETKNFGGLGSLILDELHQHHELFIGGRNGLGKSQLLLCIALASRSDISMQEVARFIGPSHTTASITVDFLLDPSESELLATLAKQIQPDLAFRGSILRSELQLERQAYIHPQWSDENGDYSITSIMQDPVRRASALFANVTYLPADRFVDRRSDLALSLTSLSRSRNFELAQQTINQQVSDSNTFHNFDVFSSLAALHYAGKLSEGDHPKDRSSHLDDFFSIARAFNRATGKQIKEPSLKPDGRISLDVLAPGGHEHGINMLSSGELVALQLLQFVKMHLHRGSILLVDEPEQHLHPSLQVEIANAVRDSAGDGQLWMVTHSPNILNTAPGKDVILLSRDHSTGATEANFADSQAKKLELLSDLGVAPGLWVPGDFIVIVEGQTDETYLRRLLPDRFASAFFVVGGNSSSVRSLTNRMHHSGALPYMAILDRDGMPDYDRDQWNAGPTRFMWSGYAIESLFLNPQWISATLSDIDPSWTEARACEELEASFSYQCTEVERRWLRKEVVRRVPSRDNHRASLRDYWVEAQKVAAERVSLVDSEETELKTLFATLWDSDKRTLVDPKKALGGFKQGVYKTTDHLISAMLKKLSTDDALTPDDLILLDTKIAALISGNPI